MSSIILVILWQITWNWKKNLFHFKFRSQHWNQINIRPALTLNVIRFIALRISLLKIKLKTENSFKIIISRCWSYFTWRWSWCGHRVNPVFLVSVFHRKIAHFLSRILFWRTNLVHKWQQRYLNYRYMFELSLRFRCWIKDEILLEEKLFKVFF